MSENLYEKISAERKQLQKEGLVPEWYNTGAYQIFKRKYEYETNGRSVRGQFERIAATAAKYLKGTKWEKDAEQKFFDLFWKGWLSPSTPVLANMGTSRGLPVSCSGSVIDDSIDGFYSNRRETALLTKHGFGTSAYLGNIRPRGSSISVGGKASGVLPVFKGHVQDMRDVAQGTARRGAWAGYIEIDHGDFDELVDFISAEVDDCNIGWIITDNFINRLEGGDAEAVRRFQRAMKMKMITGRGYFFFIDKVNRSRPEAYVNNDLTVKSSNLCCVTADQRVVTSEGILTVGELYQRGNDLEVFGIEGKRSSTPMKKYKENTEILEIVTKEGYTHKVTPDHRVMLHSGEWVEAQDLKIEDRLMIQQEEGLFGKEHNPELAFIMGLVAGDGSFADCSVCVDLWEECREFENEVLGIIHSLIKDEHIRTNGTLTTQFNKKSDRNCIRLCSAPLARVLERHGFTKETKTVIPELVWRGTKETVGEYLRGVYATDGHLESGKRRTIISLASVDKKFLTDIQILLANLGIKSSLYPFGKGGLQDFGKGGVYEINPSWRLVVQSLKAARKLNNLIRLTDIRFGKTRDVFVEQLEDEGYNVKKYATVSEIRKLPNEDAYCLTVDSESSSWVCNGMITHNCEIALHADEDHTFTCVLSAMNVSKFDEWKDTDAVFWATIFLDCVAENFIDLAKNISGLEKAVRFTRKGRALGLGQCGLHTYFQQNMIPFESLDAIITSQTIAKHIWEESERASKELATELGEPEWCKGLGLRNTHRIACMPTKTTAGLMGGISEGINPDPAMTFSQTTAAGEIDRINPTLLKIMKERGVYDAKHLKEISEKFGSVQHVDWLTADEKKVFKTAFEINQKSILKLASLRKKYVDQWQSLNLFFAAEEDPAWIAEVHTEAFRDPNILGLYYVYTQAGIGAAKEQVCEACQ